MDAIYNEFNSQQPQSILTVLNDHMPAEVRYLISNRPYGKRLELMIASPDWSAAQLARRLIIRFNYPQDLTAVLDNLSSHEAVESVYFDFTLNPLEIQPEQPSSEEDIVVNLSYLPFGCDYPSPTNSSGEDYDVTINGSVIELDVSAYRNFLPSTTICSISPTQLSAYNLGSLPTGDYTVMVNHVYNADAFPVTQQQRNVVGQFPLMVRGSQVTAVPAFSFWAVISLTCLLLISSFPFRERWF
ncbi:hypothetical protein [Marinicella rhabdoformis]|uniref:hypothetical protein n=1 Tax=Marinicella rhabdoformis TaxID=2580566 RepID=UPI0012AED72F|nr:hypothetical protein [Marinicella rhabdoformis]